MSAEFWNKLKHNTAELDALKRAYDELAERVLALEAAKPSGSVMSVAGADEATVLDGELAASLAPRRGPGRPRKVQ